MKRTSLVALVILATQFTGCSRKSETNQTKPTVEANTNQTATADATATHQTQATVEAKTTNQSAAPGVTATSPPTQEAYRVLKKEDGIEFAFLAEIRNAGPTRHVIQGPFGLMDGGRFIPLDIVNNAFDDEITTYLFGVIKVSDDSSPYVYSATESQIKKIHEFLSNQAKSSTTPSK